MVFVLQNLGCWQDVIFLLVIFFSANQTQKATKELAYCIPQGVSCRKQGLNWTIIHYL